MNDISKDIQKTSNRIVKLFNAAKGRKIGEIPGVLPPFSKYLNGKFIDAKRGEVELEFELKEEWANPTGLLHGGMQGALIDDSVGIASATLGYKGFLITIDSQLNYLGKVKVGEIVRTKAQLVREGRNIVHFFCEIKDKEGKLIATGNSNLLKTQYTPDYIKNLDGNKYLK